MYPEYKMGRVTNMVQGSVFRINQEGCLDELPSADTNEIALCWNSSAVFVGAFFNASNKGE